MFLFIVRQPNSGQGLRHYRNFTITLRHTHTQTHSVGLLRKTISRHRNLYLTTHNTQRHIHASAGIRTRNPKKRMAADPHLRPRSHWERHECIRAILITWIYSSSSRGQMNPGERQEIFIEYPIPVMKQHCTVAPLLTEEHREVASLGVKVSWNVMAHVQKPDFVFRRNGRVHLNRRGASVQSTTGSWGVRINGSNAGYTIFWGCVKSTGHPLHSTVSRSLPLPFVTVYSTFETWWHTRRNQIWSFSETDESI